MFSVRGPKFKYFALVMAAIALVMGVYMTFFQSAGYVKTKATVVSVEEDPVNSTADDTAYIVMVEYVADGTHYTARLDYYSPSFKPGKTVDILYDPQNPSVIHGGKGFGVYLIVLGIAIIAVVAVSGSRNRRAQKEAEEWRERRGGAAYAPSAKGVEREVYFLTDTGTPRYGHRIEDKNRRVLYEAKMTKFTLTSAYHFDFIDHEHNVTTPHLVGHEEATDWGDSLLLDSHNTFELDGESIWKHLRRHGVSIETERKEGTIMPCYRVSRDGEEIALIESSSQFVHEEDAEAHSVMSKVPVPGYYRIWTREETLDVVFVAALAFARSGALNDEGGGFGKMARQSLGRRFGKQ